MDCCLISWFKSDTGKERNGHSGGSCSKVSNVSLPQTPARSDGDILQSSNLKSFSFSELRTATGNFKPDSVLGEGGFGSMFKGWIDAHILTAVRPGTGMAIAVKRLNLEASQGHKDWLAEINYFGQLYHPNLVKLVGYSLEDEHLLLVYEFLPKGSLENHLFTRSSYDQPLSWKLRIQVALGAAKGLAFLHSDEAKVVYRDFKTSSILLDSNFEAKLSDFGVGKDWPTGDKSHVSTRFNMGTFGYVAPEFIAKGCRNRKSNVYSFGVVFLEMLCGKRVLDKNRALGEDNLIEWAKTHLTSKRKMLLILDSRIQGQYTVRGALKAIKLAIQCISVEPKFRPDMDEVVKALEQLQESEETQGREDPAPMLEKLYMMIAMKLTPAARC